MYNVTIYCQNIARLVRLSRSPVPLRLYAAVSAAVVWVCRDLSVVRCRFCPAAFSYNFVGCSL